MKDLCYTFPGYQLCISLSLFSVILHYILVLEKEIKYFDIYMYYEHVIRMLYVWVSLTGVGVMKIKQNVSSKPIHKNSVYRNGNQILITYGIFRDRIGRLSYDLLH